MWQQVLEWTPFLLQNFKSLIATDTFGDLIGISSLIEISVAIGHMSLSAVSIDGCMSKQRCHEIPLL